MPVLSFPYLHFLPGQRHVFPTVLRPLLLCLPLLLPLKTQAQAQAQQNTEQGAVLKRVILVTRHGIRSPTQTPESLEAKTGVIWSAWPVPPGELTEHGRTDVARLGAFLHRYYQAFLPQNARPCATPSSLFVWADAADNRTRETGNVLSKTLSAGCLKTAASLPAGQKDPLFNALASGHETLDEHSVLSTLTQTLPHGEAAPEDVRQATSSLQTLFAPQGCTQSKGVCFSAPAKLSWKKGAPHVTGGLALASTVSENLLLEYCEGLASTVQASALTREHVSSASPTLDDQAVPHQAALLATVVPAHTYLSHLTRRLPAIAIPRGRYLADAIGSLLTDPITRLPDGSTIPASSRMVVFVGHDTTLDMLATLFGLDWTFTDQPDPTAPDTTLGFELWQDGTGAPFVRFVVFHQSLEQLRNASPVEDRTDSGNPVILRSSLCPKGKEEEKCRPLVLMHSLRSEEGQMLQKSP